jgi:two-component system, OmpR family, sensor histidine kinase VicK
MESKVQSFKVIREIGKVSPDGYFLYSLVSNKFIYSNNAFAKILGIPKENIENDSYDAVMSAFAGVDPDYLKAQIDQLLLKSKVTNVEIQMKNGTDKYISCDAYLLKNRNVVAGIIKDISRSRQHLNYIVEFGARKDAILDMVAHNLSGPLNLTTNLLNIVDEVAKSQKYKKIDNQTRLIRENTQKCIEVINSFLKQEHLVSERIFVKKTQFDVIERIEIVISLLKEFVGDRQLKVLSPVKELMVTSDDVKFFQIIHNLLSNALKFTPAKGKIVVEVKQFRNTFAIAVTDNGIGIPDFLHPHLFKKNTPASREGLRGEKSIGVGLYIVKELTQLLGGSISFESEENKGASFTVELPIA